MGHVLDNPPWHALTTGNSKLAQGKRAIRFFEPEVSPFAGMEVYTNENFKLLYDQMPDDRTVLIMSINELDVPPFWHVKQMIKGLQMVKTLKTNLPDATVDIVNLDNRHVEQMMALTQLTRPGPFGKRTIEFGHYEGIFDGDKLVAMCGQRMQPLPFTEISAVCTHPDYIGKGYARQLMTNQLKRIAQNGETSFLHARHDNDRAIKVYQSLGFAKRSAVYFYLMNKKR